MFKGKISPASLGLLIFVMCICISIGVVTAGYLPLYTYRQLEAQCNLNTSAFVYEDSGQVKDGVYYYGPNISYISPNKDTIHTKIVSTVKYPGKDQWEENTQMVIKYSSSDLSLVMFNDGETSPAEKRFNQMSAIAAIVAGFGAAVLILTLLNQFIRTRPVKYDQTPDGASFEEWQQKKLLEEQTSEAEKKMNSLEESDNEEASQDG